MKCMVAFLVALSACDGLDPEDRRRNQEAIERELPCQDESSLLATTAASPNGFKCPNRDHVMRVEWKTLASNEEAAALVFCECKRDEELRE